MDDLIHGEIAGRKWAKSAFQPHVEHAAKLYNTGNFLATLAKLDEEQARRSARLRAEDLGANGFWAFYVIFGHHDPRPGFEALKFWDRICGRWPSDDFLTGFLKGAAAEHAESTQSGTA